MGLGGSQSPSPPTVARGANHRASLGHLLEAGLLKGLDL